MSSEKMLTLIEGFASDLEALVREQVLMTLQEALSGGSVPAAAPRRRGAAPKAAKSNGAARAKGAKRAPEELAALTETLYGQVKESPGLRVEELAKVMGVTTKDLALPAKKLLADGRIYTEGQKRATKYFVGKGSGARAAAAKPRAAARRTRSGKKKAKAKSGKKKSRRPRGTLRDAWDALDQLGESPVAEPEEQEEEEEEEEPGFVRVQGSGEPFKKSEEEEAAAPESGEQPVITPTGDGRFQVTIDGKAYFAKRERDLRKRLHQA